MLPFLSTSDESEAENQLVDLLANNAAPAIEDIVSSTLGQLEPPETDRRIQETQDVEDIISEVILKILDRLRRLRELPDEPAIGDFIGYVNVAAHNACNSYLRNKYPNRARFKSRVRYALTHRADFAIWEGADKRWICGFSQWREQHRPVNCDWINQARMHPERLVRHGETDDLMELIRAAFVSAQAPIPMEDLVDVAAKILEIADDAPSINVDVEQTAFRNPAAAAIDPVEVAAQRLYLKRLWNEIQQLPLAQRIALLLSVRDGTGTSVTVLLSEIKIASIREIAEAVGMSAGEFVRVFQELPLDDNAISKRLGVSRQQVISYRLSARRRLDRRMKSGG